MIGTFLMSTTFRWLFGELFGWLNRREEHKLEMEMARLQHEQAREKREWQKEAVADAAAAGVRLIEAKREADAEAASNAQLQSAIDAVGRLTGIKWVDTLNQSVRPVMAYVALMLVVGNSFAPDKVVLSALALELCASILGVFVGGRIRVTGR